ncbi:hypothetical protein Q1695_012033 [Nippostrongylus brasiliensis]|nr:hypothetical protein Q1695_012033 [Nippostrongylus brasiliensis]
MFFLNWNLKQKRGWNMFACFGGLFSSIFRIFCFPKSRVSSKFVEIHSAVMTEGGAHKFGKIEAWRDNGLTLQHPYHQPVLLQLLLTISCRRRLSPNIITPFPKSAFASVAAKNIRFF